MGAVMSCGPAKLRHRMALVAIADAADDFGFAVLSIETIAGKSVCDPRTAMRVVQALEREQWVRVQRRVTDGKGSVYFIDVTRLGVVADAKSRKSPMHMDFERDFERKKKSRDKTSGDKKSGDNLSPEASAATDAAAKPLRETTLVEVIRQTGGSGDKMSREKAVDSLFLPAESGDNSQGVQVTNQGGSGDKNALPISKNRFNHWNPDNSPLPPSQASGARRELTPAMVARKNGKTAMNEAIRESLADAVLKVMRECGLSDPRMLQVIARAIATEHACFDSTPDARPDCNRTAELMIGNYQLFCDEAHLMRHSVSPRNFFATAIWRKQNLWPYDQQRLREMRRL